MLVAFALIVIIDGVEQPDITYWQSIYTCNLYSHAIEHAQTHPDDRRTYNCGQVNVTAYCKPVIVDDTTEVLKDINEQRT